MGLSPGTTLGPYEIVAPLGAGAMGEVYRATDPRLRREVAIKVLPAAFAADPARLRRFEQEALAAASLNHPNILAVFDIGLHDGAPYIVSELLEGGTLRESLAAGELGMRRAVEYAIQVAYGLAAAHEKGIVHRDLKPENLFVTRDGRVKILDFGLAKLTLIEPASGGTAQLTAAAGTEPGMIVGTVGYMSPEQVRGEAADHRSDIFSFAVILYEMLTGRRAFEGPSAVETMHAILKADPPDSARVGVVVPPALERTIRRCLEKNPDQRFQSAKDLGFNLEAIAAEAGASVVMPAVQPLPAKARSRLVPALAIGFAIVAAAVGGFFAARSMSGTPQPTFTRVTFRRGTVQSARFAPDGQTIVFSAAWQGDAPELFSTRIGSAEARALGIRGASILSMSKSGEMALRLANGTLARAPLAGGAPREMIERVVAAAWAPDGQSLAVVRAVDGRRRIEFPPGNVLYETAGLVSEIAIAPDAKSIACIESPQGIGPVISVGLVDVAHAHKTLSGGWRAIRGIVWSRRGDEVWFAASKQLFGIGTIFAVTPAGRLRDVVKAPGNLHVFDTFGDGGLLVGRADNRVEARGIGPGEGRERDLSWFDFTGLSDLSADGNTMIITEDGEAGFRVYARKTDGSPAVEIGEGGAFGLSPDGRSVLFQTLTPLRFGVMPIGPGEPRIIEHPGFNGYQWANWFADGQRILFAGSEAGHGLRVYVENADGTGRHPIGGEPLTIATGSQALSPDGTVVAAMASGRATLVPVAGGPPRTLPGAAPGEVPSRWTPDGRFVYVFRRDELPAHVYRVDVESGRRELWKEFGPSDPAGVTGLSHIMFTPDGKSYVYNYARTISDLYLIEGAK
jgi:eukaryotic-like serine/threonine-protein kinase